MYQPFTTITRTSKGGWMAGEIGSSLQWPWTWICGTWLPMSWGLVKPRSTRWPLSQLLCEDKAANSQLNMNRSVSKSYYCSGGTSDSSTLVAWGVTNASGDMQSSLTRDQNIHHPPNTTTVLHQILHSWYNIRSSTITTYRARSLQQVSEGSLQQWPSFYLFSASNQDWLISSGVISS